MFTINVPDEPTLNADGTVRVHIQVLDDGVVISDRTEDRVYPRADDPDLRTAADRIAAFKAGLVSEADALNAQAARLALDPAEDDAQRKAAADADMTAVELAKIAGFTG